MNAVSRSRFPPALRGAAAGLALAGVLILAHGPALRGEPLWDDDAVFDHPSLKRPEGLWAIWFNPAANLREDHYWPLVYTSFWLEHRLWGGNPAAHHAVNLALHALTALLGWRILRRMGAPGAGLAAAVFALHPARLESVAWIIERKDVLSGVFALAAWLWIERTGPERPAVRAAGGLLLFLAALLSKSAVVGLPLAWIIARALVPGSRREGGRGGVSRNDWIVFALMTALAAVVTAFDLSFAAAQQRRQGIVVEDPRGAIEKLLTAARSVWFHLGKLLWPSSLSAVYPRWDVSAGRPLNLLFGAAVPAGLGLLGMLARGRLTAFLKGPEGREGLEGRGPLPDRTIALGSQESRLRAAPLAAICFYGALLAPGMGLAAHTFMRHGYAADRFAYLASFAPAALLCGLGAAAARRMKPGGGALVWRFTPLAAAGMLALTAALHWANAAAYASPEALFGHALVKNPGYWSLHYNLGLSLARKGRSREAAAAYERALELNPEDLRIHNNLGNAYSALGRREEAAAIFRRAIVKKPDYYEALQNLANLLAGMEAWDEAAARYAAAARLRPGDAGLRSALGAALTRLGRLEEARSALAEAARLDPGEPAHRRNLEAVEAALAGAGVKADR